MRVIVTGGCGYLGCRLVPYLISKGHNVTILDSQLYGNAMGDCGAKFVKGDISDFNLMSTLMVGTDVLVHLAAIVGDQACDIDKEAAIGTNFSVTQKIAGLCKKNKVRMIYTSTCSVYGAQPKKKLTEKSYTTPISVYGLSKFAAEQSVLKSGKNSIVFRLGTMYGTSPRMRFDLVVNTMTLKAARTGKIDVFGGDQFRPLVHVQDVAEAIEKALEIKKGGIFNLGGHNYRIKDVANAVKQAVNCDVVVHEELKDKRNYIVSSEKAKKAFGVKFDRDIEFGVKEISKWINDNPTTNFNQPVFNNATFLSQARK